MPRSIFCSIVGVPNAGKSSFLNTLFDMHLTIVSKKPQTTRNSIPLIYQNEALDLSIIFCDTPGILYREKHKLDQHMKNAISKSILDQDAILFFIPMDISNLEAYIPWFEKALQHKKEMLFIITKADKYQAEKNLPIEISPLYLELVELQKSYAQDAQIQIPIFAISIYAKESFEPVIHYLNSKATDTQVYFEEDILSQRSTRFFCQEFIRETILELIDNEVPHQAFVLITEFQEKSAAIYIKAFIYVHKESHKSILIGKNGSMIKRLGSISREKIAEFTEKSVYLELQVQHKKNWRDSAQMIQLLDQY